MAILLAVLAVAIAPLLLAGAIYNRLVTLWNRYRNAYSQIDVQLKRRYELIPNLVEVTKKYLQHERDVMTGIAEARGQALAARGAAAASPGEAVAMGGIVAAETALTGALGRFFGIVEKYPDLKGDKTMGRLMEELSSAENRIAFARQAYNDAVMFYNTALEVFPNVLLARSFGFKAAAFFEVDDAREREALKVALQ